MNIGDFFEEELKFDYYEMLTFLETVKDINPIHRLTEEELKVQANLDTLTVQGMYAVCMFSGLLSKNFPNCVNVSRKATFIRPIYLADTFKISLKVRVIREEEGLIVLKGYIKNSAGKPCVDCVTEIKYK